MLPPPALARSLAPGAQRGTRHGVLRWRRRLGGRRPAGRPLGRPAQQLGVGRQPMRPALPARRSDAPLAAAGWLEARDLRALWRWGRAASLLRRSADPGRLALAGGIGLRWDEVLVRERAAAASR